MRRPKVYIIILNWNGWRDTIECLESVFRLDYADFQIVVCDNGSTDGSVEQIRSWAAGNVEAIPRNPALESLTKPNVAKPISCMEISADSVDLCKTVARLILIQTGANLGFAGGNNVGLVYALNRGDCDFVWLLNNDTVVRPDALSQLVRRMETCPDIGMCGSTLLYYTNPERIHACGGAAYNKWLGRAMHVGLNLDANCLLSSDMAEPRFSYVIGASMLVRKELLLSVGLMNEEYFLFFEELDWAMRALGKFRLGYAPQSTVYHKEGASTGQSFGQGRRSGTAEFYLVRNRMLFTRKYHPNLRGVMFAVLAGNAIRKLARGNSSEFLLTLKALIAGFRIPRKSWTPSLVSGD